MAWIEAKDRRPALAAEPLLAAVPGFHVRRFSSPATIRNASDAGWALGDAAAPVRRWQRLQWQ